MAQDETVKSKDIAHYLKLMERTFYRLTQDGQVPGFKVRDSLRLRLEDIEALIEAQKAEVRRDGGRR